MILSGSKWGSPNPRPMRHSETETSRSSHTRLDKIQSQKKQEPKTPKRQDEFKVF